MSMSKKLTFSLASLVVLIALVAVPVMAQRAVVEITTGEIAATVAPDTHSFGVVARSATKLGENVAASPSDVQSPLFAVPSLPDLDEQLLTGVTIALVAPTTRTRDGGVVDADAAPPVLFDIEGRDVVISEIMWGYNSNVALFPERINEQWIELYSTGVTIDVSTWKLVFVNPHDLIPAVGGKFKLTLDDDEFVTTAADDDVEYMVVDTVSTLAGGGWSHARDGSQGQGGVLVRSGVTDVTLVDMVSMYRKGV